MRNFNLEAATFNIHAAQFRPKHISKYEEIHNMYTFEFIKVICYVITNNLCHCC